MTRSFEVVAGEVPTWSGITPAGEVVARFLGLVRVTGDAAAAAQVMAPLVRCHQVVSDEPQTVVRSPDDYAAHVREMLAAFGRFRFFVDDLLADGDRVYVRWHQDGRDELREDGRAGTGRPVRDVGSAVYRVEEGRVVEYWIQLDRQGLQAQLPPVGEYVHRHTLDNGS